MTGRPVCVTGNGVWLAEHVEPDAIKRCMRAPGRRRRAYRDSRFSRAVFTCLSWSNTALGVVPKKAKPALIDQ